MTLFYVGCWTEGKRIFVCGHEHPTIDEALQCIVPNGRFFIRACDKGVVRSISEKEMAEFLVALSRARRRI